MAKRELSREAKAEHAIQEDWVKPVPARVYDVHSPDVHRVGGFKVYRVIVDNEGGAQCSPDCKAAIHGNQECWHVLAARVRDKWEMNRRRAQ